MAVGFRGQVSPSSRAQDIGCEGTQPTDSASNPISYTVPHSSQHTAGRIDDPSSQSRSGSETTQSQEGSSDDLEDDVPDEDRELLKVLRQNMAPDAAHRFYQKTRGKVVFDPRRPLESAGAAHSLSILEALRIDVQNFRVPIRSATSDSSGESSTGSGSSSGSDSSPARGTGPSGSGFAQQDEAPNGGQIPEDGPNRAAEFNHPPAGVESPVMRLLRCPHHAAFPEHYCANDRTGQKYRTCSGPGYTKMQYLKEHIKNVHVANPHRCHICQKSFKTESELEDHTRHDDGCRVRCPEPACGMEFPNKSQRDAHVAEQHPATDCDPALNDMDEKMHTTMKKCLRQFTSALKRGRAVGDRARNDWVEANTNDFMEGRSSDPKINPLLELGQWYVVFTTLFPRSSIPESPFYPPQQVALSNEVVIETVIYYYDMVLHATYGENGPLPVGPQEFRDVSRDTLRAALNIAAQTRLLPAAFGHLSPAQDSQQASVDNNQDFLVSSMADSSAQLVPVNYVPPQGSSVAGPIVGQTAQQYPVPVGNILPPQPPQPVGAFGNGFGPVDFSDVLGQNQQPSNAGSGGWGPQ
ncbi:hypothetical protein QBC34DRAFT_309135 [Podospora aff. communis PSN243]|uniref:C2H2-type domain-containing protein n=1 Tax=Podospora aff. communis PSN243 TaxID=3040156 RepID=A0AAV9G8C4_9PEZI|nr:hypothetical protein QBC34DRAFT_309135 [Podospora aff. communis PSN243]